MKVTSSLDELRHILAQSSATRSKGPEFIPTMGALHEGHLALVAEARKDKDAFVVVSIFVNRLQFNNADDLESYPSTLAGDLKMLKDLKVDLVFTPDDATMYPPQHASKVVATGRAGKVLCAKHRDGHFDGVLTAVCKLFNLVNPARAYFGEKDFQQLLLIKNMCRDLNIATQIVPVATKRDADFLALSSRNVRLSVDERKLAARVPEICMRLSANLAQAAEDKAQLILTAGQEISALEGLRLEYLELRDTDNDLAQITSSPLPDGARLFVSFYLGETRLIDNYAIGAR